MSLKSEYPDINAYQQFMEPIADITQIITNSDLDENKKSVLFEMVKKIESPELEHLLAKTKESPEVLDVLSKNILMKIEYLKGDSGITEESIVEYEKELAEWLG